MLDKQGLALAVILALIILVFGDLRYLLTMLIFLFLSVVATKYEHQTKREFGIYEHERSWENVLSNGLVPTLLVLAVPILGPIPYLASVAAIMADKFASELGVLADNPISLETLKPVKRGKSGAVSALGLLTSFAGAIIIGLSGIVLFSITPTTALFIGVCGFFGAFVDSIFGVFEEHGIGTKGTSNFICSASGALFGYLLNSYGIIANA
jgi:uncharacterized protein (TIGR00297 family)